MRFFGFTALSTTARPRALNGVNASIVAIHFGMGASTPGAGRLRQLRSASTSSTTPSTTCTVDEPSDALESVATLLASAIAYATATTTPSPRTQPSRNAGPFVLARSENSIRMTAMIGIGLIATPTAYGSTSLMA